MYGQTAKEQYKAAYSALRNKARGLTYWQDSASHFGVNDTFYRVTSLLNPRFVIAANKSLYNRSQEFKGSVYFDWSYDLKDYRLTGHGPSSQTVELVRSVLGRRN